MGNCKSAGTSGKVTTTRNTASITRNAASTRNAALTGGLNLKQVLARIDSIASENRMEPAAPPPVVDAPSDDGVEQPGGPEGAGQESVADHLVELTAVAAPSVLRGVKTNCRVLFKVKTGSVGNQQARQPVDLCLLIDRSGSMGGSAIENARRAVCHVIDLLGPDDTLHLLAYESKTETIFSGGNRRQRQQLQQQVNRIHASGGTNISEGLVAAFEVLSRSNTGNPKRLFMFSDGQANGGLSSTQDLVRIAERMQRHGVSTSCFGLGHSYNEQMMEAVARGGHGQFIFINAPAEIVPKVGTAMNLVSNMLATNAQLTVRGLDGAIVTKIYGHDDLASAVQLGDLRESDIIHTVACVDVSPDGREASDIVTYELRFEDLESGRVISRRGVVSVHHTDSHEEAQARPDELRLAVTITECGDRDLEVMQQLDSGNREKAISLKEETLAQLREVRHLDADGMVEKLLQFGNQSLEQLKSRAANAEATARKALHYDNYHATKLCSAGLI